MGKGEIARNKQFLLFPKCFLLNQITVSPFVHNFDIISLFAAESEKPKIGISGKELIIPYMKTNSNTEPNSKIIFYFFLVNNKCDDQKTVPDTSAPAEYLNLFFRLQF